MYAKYANGDQSENQKAIWGLGDPALYGLWIICLPRKDRVADDACALETNFCNLFNFTLDCPDFTNSLFFLPQTSNHSGPYLIPVSNLL